MFIRHRVADFDAWFAPYPGNTGCREAGRVTAEDVRQAAGDPLDVTVTHDFETVEVARACAANPALADIMAEVVVGQAQVWVAAPAAR